MKNKLERSLSNNHRERNEMMMMRSVVTSRRVMVRSIHGVPFENSGVTSPSLLYLISIIFYSCNIIIVIAAIPRDHRRLLPRQFEERSLGMKKKTMEPIICLKWDGESEMMRNLLVYFWLELRRVVADDRDAWSRENRGENGNEGKKKKKAKLYISIIVSRVVRCVCDLS